MGKLSRTKGAAFERERCNWWKKQGFENARRKLSQYQQSDGRDIENIEPYCEQCKVGKAINIKQAYLEAQKSAKEGEIALASIKYDRSETLIVLSEKDFEWLLGTK